MLKDIPISEARHELTSLPERFRRGQEVVSVTRRGKPVLAILPWESYETLMETLEILGDVKMVAVLRQGIKELKEGKGVPWEQVKRKLDL